MSLTVASVEAVLIRRCGPAMAVVAMDVSSTSPNPDLADPIRIAARGLGLSLASPLSVVDADLASLAGFAVERLLDLAERRTLETVLNRYTEVDAQVDRDAQKASQFADRLVRRIAALDVGLAKPYGPGSRGPVGSALVAGRPTPNASTFGDPRGWPIP